MKKKYRNVLITGGAGYCGSILVPKMLSAGYRVTVYDIQYYGYDFSELDNTNLSVVKGDIRDIEKLGYFIKDSDAILHLACISNDASFELDEQLSTSVNMDAFEPIVLSAKNAGVSRFIFASSSSVFGISKEPDVKEDHPLVPLTLYNKYKGLCEPILFKHTDDNFTGVVFRPATVCGYGPRQRLDVSVNILTNLAVNKGEITVFGGSQLRPNLHIQDYADLCMRLLEAPTENISNQIFNCGYENMSIMEIAKKVKKVVEEEFPEKDKIGIKVTPTDDLRSYHINSDKINEVIDFKPQYSVENAIRDLCIAFRKGELPNSLENDIYFNVRTMKNIRAS